MEERLFFIDDSGEVFRIEGSGAPQKLSEAANASSVSFGGDRLWISRADGSIAWLLPEGKWQSIRMPEDMPATRVVASAGGNAIILTSDLSLMVYVFTNELKRLAPPGMYADVAVGPDGSLLFVPQPKEEGQNLPLMWTTLKDLRPQPVWSGAVGRRVAWGGPGCVAFITIAGEVGSSTLNQLAELHSEAGKAFATELSVHPKTGTFYITGYSESPGAAAPVYSWNRQQNAHNEWQELKGIRARAIAAG